MLNRLDRPGKAEATGLGKGAGEREGRLDPVGAEAPEARPDRSEAPECRKAGKPKMPSGPKRRFSKSVITKTLLPK